VKRDPAEEAQGTQYGCGCYRRVVAVCCSGYSVLQWHKVGTQYSCGCHFDSITHCSALQHTATYCNDLPHSAATYLVRVFGNICKLVDGSHVVRGAAAGDVTFNARATPWTFSLAWQF